MLDAIYTAIRNERKTIPYDTLIDRNLLLTKAALDFKFAPRKFHLEEVAQLLKEEFNY